MYNVYGGRYVVMQTWKSDFDRGQKSALVLLNAGSVSAEYIFLCVRKSFRHAILRCKFQALSFFCTITIVKNTGTFTNKWHRQSILPSQFIGGGFITGGELFWKPVRRNLLQSVWCKNLWYLLLKETARFLCRQSFYSS